MDEQKRVLVASSLPAFFLFVYLHLLTSYCHTLDGCAAICMNKLPLITFIPLKEKTELHMPRKKMVPRPIARWYESYDNHYYLTERIKDNAE